MRFIEVHVNQIEESVIAVPAKLVGG